MVEAKKSVCLLVLILLSTSVVFGLDLDIGISADIDHSVKDFQYTENFTDVFEINASVRNRGSFECRYRLRADINETESRENYKAYSRASPLLPSGTDRLKVYASPKNYTGPIEGNLYIEYCGREVLVQNFTSKSIEPTVSEDNFSLNETSVSERETEADLDINETLLVPQEYPAYWKVGHAVVDDFNTTLDYEMPFVNYDRNITYTAFNKTTMKPIGKVKADLQMAKEDKDFIQKIIDKKYQVGLALSGLLNLALAILLMRRKSSKLKF